VRDKKYLLGSTVNLATLLVGLALGFIFGSMRTETVKAQSTLQPVEQVAPNITSGTAAFGTVLAEKCSKPAHFRAP
jgi:hypothetical protein